jgi:hypothetical protein
MHQSPFLFRSASALSFAALGVPGPHSTLHANFRSLSPTLPSSPEYLTTPRIRKKVYNWPIPITPSQLTTTSTSLHGRWRSLAHHRFLGLFIVVACVEVPSETCNLGEVTMQNLINENWLSVQQAAALLPPGRGGRPVAKSTVVGWIETGAPGPDGKMVKLEAVRCGSRWITSREALARFMAKLTPATVEA